VARAQPVGVLTLAGVALVTALGFGWGGGSEADQLALGRKLYQVGSYPSCALCHGIRSAAATSPFAVDFDAATREDTRGKSKLWIERWVLRSIRSADCLDPHDAARCMPRYLLSGKDALAVAAFIATCGGHSGRSGCEPVAALHGAAGAGFHDYQTLGCASCHFGNLSVAIAPSLKGLAGSRVRLASGKTVIADSAYLVASILTPDRDTVKGYARGVMSSRIRPGQVSAAQAKALVAYLRTLK
jgi:mono/diheme cytochrome c family protein